MNFKHRLMDEGMEAAVLDDLVHEAASAMGSNANNGGMKEQLEFLLSVCGYTEAEIWEKLEITTPL